MAVISITDNPDSSWVVAGWAFRQLLADTYSKYASDADLVGILKEAEELGYLHITYIDEPTRSKTLASLVSTAREILEHGRESGIEVRFGDPEMVKEYSKGLLGFLEVADAWGQLNPDFTPKQ